MHCRQGAPHISHKAVQEEAAISTAAEEPQVAPAEPAAAEGTSAQAAAAASAADGDELNGVVIGPDNTYGEQQLHGCMSDSALQDGPQQA